MDDAGLIGAIGALVGLLVAGSLGTAGYLYGTDYGLKADVEHTNCSVPLVSVKTHAFNLHHDVTGLPVQQCLALNPGDHVIYHIRSKHTTIYDSQGQCQYDSESGIGCGQVIHTSKPLL